VWATEFSNVHTTFAFDEPGFEVGGVALRQRGALLPGRQVRRDARATTRRLRALAADPSPESAFRVGRTHGLRADWEAVKDGVMREALAAKFTQDDGLRALLLATGEAPLVQLKPGDAYWGTGPDGRGRNALGAQLVALRAALAAP
jgi:ribA/ribD-fused uncharacterized protein